MYIEGKYLKKRSGRTDVDTNTTVMYYYQDGSGTPVYQWTLPANTARNHTRFTGWDIPDYHRKLKSGKLLPHTPFHCYRSSGDGNCEREITLTSGRRYYTDPSDVYPGICGWHIHEEDIAAHAPLHGDKYVQEAASRIYSHGWDALTFLAELASIRTMFAGAVKTAANIARPKNWKRISATNEWLSYRYGWRTLMYDIKDIHQCILNLDEKQTRFSERAGNSYSNSYQTEYFKQYTHYSLEGLTQDAVSVNLRGSVTADISIPKVLINPVATAWELIPFSFVLDWFVSVGKWIEAASFDLLAQAYAASWGYRIDMDRTFQMEIGSTESTFSSGYHNEFGQSLASLTVRVPSSVPPHPHFRLRLDQFKIMDLVGLVWQRHRR